MRKPQINSPEERSKIAAAASRPIDVPSNVPLEDKDKPFFANILAEFARSEWTAHQLELAAMLARTMADLEYEQRLLREEGSVSRSERGTPVPNPRKTLIQMHAGTILNFRRSLSLHARAQAGEPKDVGPRRAQEKALDNAHASGDELFASPN